MSQVAHRLVSSLWYHFTPVEGNKATCKYCKVHISTAGGSTSNLRRHILRRHPTVPLDRTTPVQRMPSASATAPTSGPHAPESEVNLPGPSGMQISIIQPPQAPLEQYFRKPLSAQKNKEIDVQILKMICKEYHPFSLVEDPEFRKFVNLVKEAPSYELPSRKTLTNSLLPQLYDTLAGKLREKLNSARAVALTTDAWTSITNESYIAITVHFIDEQSMLCSNLLSCLEFKERHTAENLANFLTMEVRNWNLENKISAVVTDNAHNIVSAIKICKWRHIPCYAHTINLIVKAGLNLIEPLLNKIKLLVQFFKKSTIAGNKLKESQKQMGLPELKLKQEVPTRWNSCYDMLERVNANRSPIVSALAVMGNNEHNITNDEWTVIAHTIKILEIFNAVTKEISAEKVMPLSKVLILSWSIMSFLKNYLMQDNIPPVIVQVQAIFLKEAESRLWTNVPELVLQSTLLDPRFKKKGFKSQSLFNKAHEDLVSQITAQIKAEMQMIETSQSGIQSSSHSPDIIWDNFDREEETPEVRNPKALAIVEIDNYISQPTVPRKSDPMVWWEQNKTAFPHIYKIVLKRLCIPASSVPCERVFSKTGQILNERRTRLGSSKLSKIIFINGNT